ncbi:Uncharacterised protein [Vibrio cholerae]|nr:Uncharacterised protein [Vibrio cholerae]CSC98943.1 Uncharacterised protein [Vibrio cholerae]CSD21938.1 Uncharacterised protein [Vibrio cholerae]
MFGGQIFSGAQTDIGILEAIFHLIQQTFAQSAIRKMHLFDV